MIDPVADSLLSITLSAAVPLRILIYQRRGGPTLGDLERARQTADLVAGRGDALLYGYRGGRTPKGQPAVAHIFNELADALAVLAFCPGGVTLFGSHWEAQRAEHE